ncbi:MAG: hypothetical protein ACQESR_29125, partial [Planctomycetota bacterium]
MVVAPRRCVGRCLAALARREQLGEALRVGGRWPGGRRGCGWYCGLKGFIFQAVGCFRVESCSTQAVLPWVGLAAENVIR